MRSKKILYKHMAVLINFNDFFEITYNNHFNFKDIRCETEIIKKN